MSVQALHVAVDSQRRAVPASPSSPQKITQLLTSELQPPSLVQDLRIFLQDIIATDVQHNNDENIPPTITLNTIATKIQFIAHAVLTHAAQMKDSTQLATAEWQRKLDQSQHNHADATGRLEKAKAHVAEQQKQHQSLLQQVESLQHQLEQQSTTKSKRDDAHNTLSEQLRVQQEELLHERTKTKSLSEELNKALQMTSKITNEGKELQSELASSNAQQSLMEEQLLMYKTDAAKQTASDYQKYERKIAEEQQRTKKVQDTNEKLQEQLQMVDQQSKDHNMSEQTQADKMLEVQLTLSTLKERLMRSEQGRNNAVNIQTTLRKKLASVERDLQVSKTKYNKVQTAMEEERATHESSLCTAEESAARRTEEIKTASKRAAEAEISMLEIGSRVQELEKRLSMVTQTSTTTDDQLLVCQQRCVSLESDLRLKSEHINTSTQEMTSLKSEKIDLERQLDKERAESSSQFSVLSEECRTAVIARDVASKRAETTAKTVEDIQRRLNEATHAYNTRENLLRLQENELRAAVAKLSKALDACEGEITCMHCLRVFVEPSTVVRTGHTYCAECCDTGKIEDVDVDEDRVRVKRLETLSGKFGFMKQALDQVKSKCDNVT